MMQNLNPITMPSLDKLFSMMKHMPPEQVAQDINSPDPSKKLAAMMAANSDRQLQQAAMAQQQPTQTVAQKLAQGVTQAPTQPTPAMPAVPAQAMAKPAAQGIAALQPQQTPPGSAMGILPTQSSPAPQGNPNGMPVGKAAGGIASFASGGHAQQNPHQQEQIAQALAQLMQGINQDTIQPLPQQAQQTGIAAPEPGKANPMQDYASMVFATRPQYRPGTEAAPISQDLSLSQMAQYSAQQPIAAAHGGLMHHVPEHMYKFKEGGILAFNKGKEVPEFVDPNATVSDSDPSTLSSLGNAVSNAVSSVGSGVAGAIGLGHGTKIDPKAVIAAQQKEQQTPVLNSADNLVRMSEQKPSKETNLQEGNPITATNVKKQEGPLDLKKPTNPPAPGIKAPPGGYFTPTNTTGIAATLTGDDLKDYNAMRESAKEKVTPDFTTEDAIRKHYGLDTPAGQVALQQIEELKKLHHKHQSQNELNDFIRTMRGLGRGPGGAAEAYTQAQSEHQAENEKFLWDQLKVMDEVDERNRQEKIKAGESVSKATAEKEKIRAERINKLAEIAKTSADKKADRDTEMLKSTNEILARNAQTQMTEAGATAREASRQKFESAQNALYKNLSPEAYIADRVKANDPSYVGKTHAEQIANATDELGAIKSKTVQLQALKEKNAALTAMAKEPSNFKESASINQQIQENLAQIDKLMGFEKTSTLAMPTGEKLNAYAKEHFNGDVKKATEYLQSKGYK